MMRLFSKNKTKQKFLIVFSDPRLMREDEKTIQMVANTCNVTVRVKCWDDKMRYLIIEPDEIVIIDEADSVLLDKHCRFDHVNGLKSLNETIIIGLTATGKADLLPLEEKHIEKFLRFSFLDSHIGAQVDIDEVAYSTLSAVVNDKSNLQAKLLFLAKDQLNELRVLLDGEVFRQDCSDREALKNIKAGEVLVITDPRLLRGFDYRSEAGLTIYIGAKLSSRRALKQALCRVGRYSEENYTRFLSQELAGDLVDSTERLVNNVSIA